MGIRWRVPRRALAEPVAPAPPLGKYGHGIVQGVLMELSSFDEVMQRVATNLAMLADRLRGLGYEFRNADRVLPGPDAKVEQKLARIEECIGAVPRALASFYRIVGAVDFCGSHPEWSGCDYPDPIVVEPIDSAMDELEQYLELDDPAEEYWGSESGVFRIPIAPDYYHKEDVSGGMWYGVEVPNDAADPQLLEEWHETTFVSYLEICFRWGGFPGLERNKETIIWPVRDLTQGLRPLW